MHKTASRFNMLTRSMTSVALVSAVITMAAFAQAQAPPQPEAAQLLDAERELAQPERVPSTPRGLPDVAAVFETQKDKVVGVRTEASQTVGTPLFGTRAVPRQGQGSGFIVDERGYILTNHHVVADAQKIEVVLEERGRTYTAKLIGFDEMTDLALIKIEPDRSLKPVEFGDSDTIRVGEWVVAIGNPFGLEYSVTTGIVSAKGRRLGHGLYDDFLQTDASINPGNSGGPLFDLQGRVIGVNTAIIRDGQGIGFAVPVSMVAQILPQLKDRGYVVRGYIGASLMRLTDTIAETFDHAIEADSGVLIASLEPEGPAHRAGLHVGDVVTRFGDRDVRTMQELLLIVASTQPGSTVPLGVIREGKPVDLSIRIAERPDTNRPAQRGGAPPSLDEGASKPPSLGLHVSPTTPAIAQEKGMARGERGAVLDGLESRSPLHGALRPGDVIVQAGSDKVTDPASLARVLRDYPRDRPIRMIVWRGGRKIFVAARLMPESP